MVVVRKLFKKRFRRVQCWWRKHSPLAVGLLILGGGLLVYTGYMDERHFTIDPTAYRPLLHVIARAESNGNYNAYFGNANNSEIKFTAMPIAEVLSWQQQYVNQGSPSSAVGRYQFLDSTLAGLVNELGIDPQQPFDEPTQDRLAIALVERRGAHEYASDKLSREQFAANLAKEWAGLPKVIGDNPHQSHYEGDSLNSARVGVDEVLRAIKPIKPSR